MNRRQYLTRAGAGAGTLVLAPLAGCLDDLSGSESAISVDDRTGERELARAAGRLNEAALALDIEDGGVDDSADIEFDAAEPTGLIDDARVHLETAAAELDDERAPDVETLRTYADILEALVVVTGTITDDTLEDDVDIVFATMRDAGDFSRANTVVTERSESLVVVRDRYDEAFDDFQALDGDRFEELARIERIELEDGITTLGGVLNSLAALVEGLDSMLFGYGEFKRGQVYSDNGEYDGAREAFSDAESSYEAATTTLESDEDIPESLIGHFEAARCQSGHLAAAAEAFGGAAAAADAGDPLTAQGRESDGERALEAVEDCSQ